MAIKVLHHLLTIEDKIENIMKKYMHILNVDIDKKEAIK